MGAFTESSRRCWCQGQSYKAVHDACLPIFVFALTTGLLILEWQSFLDGVA